ncbi:papilin-like isoform X2 [Megalops cyprinoides]|uniref:papilin-like isoform X2 n=1 Tax=Megalops cyprinoides TaxID=118141 RepID=UPI00186563B2|nr:papilin-like isoform X2 [Megalops cyprinoides]
MKILLILAVVQLLPAPAHLFTDRQSFADYWEDWGPWGDCSRSCGSGVTTRMRRCVTQRTDGGNNCVGPSRSYRSCNIQDCPEGSRDFREEQCSQFDGMDFQGKQHKWLPYYGAENPCELNCIPKGENYYYRHRAAVVDGTPCYPGRRDICVEGVCKSLGCDNMLESPQQEDPCLQCGGNGQSCYLVRNTFSMPSLPKGYNQMFIIPVGATTISIREMVATRNYLAIKNLRGEYYLNGHWVIDYSRATPIAGTTLYYQRGAEGDMAPETITGRGPTTEPLIIELISQEANQGVEYEYYLPHNRPTEGYFWSYGSWSQCSKECGSGYQSRLVFCAIDNEAYPDYLCASLPRPHSNRTCNTQPCPQTRSWKMGEWSACSTSCGGGSQTRTVQCLSHEAEGARVVEDSVCAAYAPRPLSQQACNLQQCAQYSVSDWSPCSVTCGVGEQTRDVVCVGAGGVRLQDYACGSVPRPVHTQPCQRPACVRRIAWHIGDWGLCSKSCGSGLRERQVICSDRERNLYGAERCNTHPKPPTVEACNTQHCYIPQLVPSMQDPSGHDNTLHGFRPFIPDNATVQRPGDPHHSNTLHDPYNPVLGPHCSQSYYGCCPDGHTPASGYHGQGCPQESCTRSRYGCCLDGVTVAHGPNRAGCPEHNVHTNTDQYPARPDPSEQCRYTLYGCCEDRVTPATGPHRQGCYPTTSVQRPACSQPHTPGPCSDWTARYYYDPATRDCVHFWYGGCQGNQNNFLTKEECQRDCHGVGWTQPHTVQVSERKEARPGRERDMRRVFTVYRASSSSSASRNRQSTSAAAQAHKARVQYHPRRPTPVQVQHTYPTESSGVSIDQSDPSTVEGRVGQTVVLPCRVTPPPSSTVIVEWRRDGIQLSPDRHRQQPNGSLLVGPLSLQDSGWLLCVATRDQERDHRYIYLSVSEGPSQTAQNPTTYQGSSDGPSTGGNNPSIPQVTPSFKIDRTGSSLVERRVGQTARLPCRINPPSALASVSIEWTKSGRPLNSLRHSQQSDGSLVIGQLTSEDSGFYTCTASIHNQRDQRQLQLKVLGDLRITTAPNNVQVSQGSTAQLPCVVSGENVNVGWSRNGVPVRPDGRHVQVSVDGSLILNNVQPADEGSYTCNAYTGTYSVSATAEVRISKASQIAPQPAVPSECVDQPDLANCDLIVYARLCTNQYYSSFCCASCARYAQGVEGPGQLW